MERLKRAVRLKQALKRNTVLNQLLAHGSRLAQAELLLAEVMPAELNGRWGVTNLRQGELVLYTASPAWAARLRFLAPGLLQRLGEQADSLGIDRIRVRVCLPPSRDRPTSRPRPRLSARSARLLEQVAEDMEDEGLRAALRRIARHGDP